MNRYLYNILKTCSTLDEFDNYDKYLIEKMCRSYEFELKKQEAIRAEKAEKIQGLIIQALHKENKALSPTDMQFVIYRETGEEIPCQLLAYFCMRLVLNKQLDFTHKKRKTYYFFRND